MILRFLVLAALAALIATPSMAHDIWLSGTNGPPPRILVHYGHPGETARPDKARVIELSVLSSSGRPVSLLPDLAPAREADEDVLSAALPSAAKEGGVVVAARYDNGFWVQTLDGFRNTNLRVLPDATKSLWSQKFAKLILAVPGERGSGWAAVAGHRLEIVPLTAPFGAQGKPLGVRVLYEGHPLAGAEIEVGDGRSKPAEQKKTATDGDGVATVTLPAGTAVLTVVHRVPGSVPDLAAQDMLAATLVITTVR